MKNKPNFDDTYIAIQGWMRSKLDLKGYPLTAFALVYGFCQDGESEFTGSLKYVMRWLGCSKPTAIKALDQLSFVGYIFKRQEVINGVTFNRYKVNFATINALRRTVGGSKESLPGVVKKFNHPSKETLPGGSKESLPNNIVLDNTNNNIVEKEKETSVSTAPKKAKRTKFIEPSFEEVLATFKEKLREKKVLGADAIAQREAEKFMAHYGANGWRVGKNKMKSWPHAVGGWITRMDQYKTTVNKTNKLEVDESPISTEDAHAIIDHFVAQGGF